MKRRVDMWLCGKDNEWVFKGLRMALRIERRLRLNELRQIKSRKKNKLCQNCGRPGTCYGSYESQKVKSYSCDECCGHGCEDGHCERITDE